jgi:hypothetical protein
VTINICEDDKSCCNQHACVYAYTRFLCVLIQENRFEQLGCPHDVSGLNYSLAAIALASS